MTDVADLFSSSASRSNRDALLAGDGEPRTVEHVTALAQRLRLDLTDIEVVVIEDEDEIDYLDAQGACACTPVERGGRQIRLGPASFSDADTLARTLGHELVHVTQLRAGDEVSSTSLGSLEQEAYAAEDEVALRLEEPLR